MLFKNVLQWGFANGKTHYFHLKLSLFHPWFSCWVIDSCLHKHSPTTAPCSLSPLCPGVGRVCQRSAPFCQSWALPAGCQGSIGNSNYTGYLNRDIWWLRQQRICLQSGRPGWSLIREGPLEEEMATHSSILACRISWTEEPGGLHTVFGVAKSRTWLSD